MLFEARSVIKSVPFIVILALAVANTLGSMINQGAIYGADLLPVTRAMIDSINSAFTWMILMIVIYYSAELVWRERQVRNHEIIDATPAPSWALSPQTAGHVHHCPRHVLVSILTAVTSRPPAIPISNSVCMRAPLFYESTTCSWSQCWRCSRRY
jgi:hypothetical protein